MVIYSTKIHAPFLDGIRSHPGHSRLTLNFPLMPPPPQLNWLRQHYYANNQGRSVELLNNAPDQKTGKQALHWRLDIGKVACFWWKSGSDTIHVQKHHTVEKKILQYWCLHVFLPFFFTLEKNIHFLHAGAVEIDGGAVLFLGESFAGKSTMTNFFLRQGHTLISDDKVGVPYDELPYLALPSYPYHRPYRAVEDIGLPYDKFSAAPQPIKAVFILDGRDDIQEPEIIPVTGLHAFRALIESSQFNVNTLRQSQFDHLSKLAQEIKVFKLKMPWGLSLLPSVYDAIIEKLNNKRSR